MTFLQVKNRAISTLAADITATDTSLTVAAGEGNKFPDSNFHITIDDEILLCTTRTGDTFTVVRAQEGTTAAPHSAGAKVELRITARIIQELQENSVVNKGKAWIAHGNNVITFPNAHSNNNYRWVVSFVQAPMGGITSRNIRHTHPLTIFTENESPTRGKVRIEGGYGFTSCGYGSSGYFGTTERFDDVANTHTVRATTTARHSLTGYSLNGYGFTSCGYPTTGTTERFDDVANTHTARASATARERLTGYSLNGYGFTSCGYSNTYLGTTERFDDVANTHTARASATARYYLAGYSLNGYGFTSCGYNGAFLGTTERFDDVANIHTARASATARERLTGYSLNGYGFTSCGYAANYLGTTERFDDVANTRTARADATARRDLAGYSLNEYFVNYLTFNE